MHQLQVPLREMEILGGGFQIFMPEQNLNGAQVGARFQKVRGPAVAQAMGRNALANAALSCGFTARDLHRLVRDGLLGFGRVARGKQIYLRLAPAPVGAQRLEQRRAQRQIPILAALAFHHADDHAPAVDVTNLQTGNFGTAHARAIKQHQQRAPEP